MPKDATLALCMQPGTFQELVGMTVQRKGADASSQPLHSYLSVSHAELTIPFQLQHHSH